MSLMLGGSKVLLEGMQDGEEDIPAAELGKATSSHPMEKTEMLIGLFRVEVMIMSRIKDEAQPHTPPSPKFSVWARGKERSSIRILFHFVIRSSLE